MDSIVAIDANAGGVTFQLFSVQGEGRLAQQFEGELSGLGDCPRLKAHRMNGDPVAHRVYRNEDVADVAAAFMIVDGWLRDELGVSPLAVGHRVVHCGSDEARPVLIDDAVMARLEQFAAVWTSHLPHNLAPIRSIRANHPALVQVACFDRELQLSRAAGGEVLTCGDEFAIARVTLALLLHRTSPL